MKIRTFWELITEDSARDGATADHGIVDADHGFVSMDGVIGDDARQVLDANALDFDLDPEARRFDLIRLGESIVEELDGVDYIDHRGDEVLFYSARDGELDREQIRMIAVEASDSELDDLELLVDIVEGLKRGYQVRLVSSSALPEDDEGRILWYPRDLGAFEAEPFFVRALVDVILNGFADETLSSEYEGSATDIIIGPTYWTDDLLEASNRPGEDETRFVSAHYAAAVWQDSAGFWHHRLFDSADDLDAFRSDWELSFGDDDETDEVDDEPAHDHIFGPFEWSRFGGALIRRCEVEGCRVVSLDGDELDDDDQLEVDAT